jgi:hypothetical protein
MFLVRPPKLDRPNREARLGETNWSSNFGGFADRLVTLQRKKSAHKQRHIALDIGRSNNQQTSFYQVK